MNPYFQRVENMYGKGGKRVYKAELRPPKVDPYFEKKNTLGGVGIADTATIQFTNLRVALEFFLSACCSLNFDATDLLQLHS